MDTQLFTVLWFDDEHATLEGIKFSAFEAGIKLAGFTNSVDGLNELNKNSSLYDAIVLDGLFQTNAIAAEKGSDSAFAKTAKVLEDRANELNLEWFILSGQTNFKLNSKTIIEVFGNKRVFDKYKVHELDELWEEIKVAANNRLATQVRVKYSKVFASLSADYWEKQARLILLDILVELEEKPNQTVGESLFNNLRKVIEYFFRACNKLGLLHDDCLPTDRVNFTWSNIFLSGQTVVIQPKNIAISCNKAHFTPLISKMIRYILDICNSASHTEGESTSIGEHQTVTQSSYLLQSCCYQMMDVILWLNQYAQQNANYKHNTALWQLNPLPSKKDDSTQQGIIGKVIRIADNGYGTFEDEKQTMTLSIQPKLVQEHQLKCDDKIKVSTKPYIDKIDILHL